MNKKTYDIIVDMLNRYANSEDHGRKRLADIVSGFEHRDIIKTLDAVGSLAAACKSFHKELARKSPIKPWRGD